MNPPKPVSELSALDAVATAEEIRAGRLSPVEAVDAAIARIEAGNGVLNAVIHERFDAARAEAAGSLPDGPFRGVPILLKDLGGQMAGEPLYQGSRLQRARDVRSTVDSHVTRRLRGAGFVVLGRTNTPEFGSAPTTEPLSFGPTRNPWHTDHSAGGSSGGSAAAVAGGFVPVAHASDGGGSIRIPASCCGLFGLKPSRGRISRGPHAGEGWGGASTDGCVSRTVRDTAAVLDVLAGAEPGDPYVAPPPARPFASLAGDNVPRLRVGVVDHAPWIASINADRVRNDDCVAAVRATAALLESMGHDVVEAYPAALDEADLHRHYVSLIAVDAALTIETMAAEIGRELNSDEVEASNLAFGRLGARTSGTQYLADLRWLHTWSRRVASFWEPADAGGEGFDLLLTPTLGRPPVRIGELVPDPDNPTPAMLEVGAWVAYTSQFNVTGQPAMNVPIHWNDAGLPVGTQLVGPAFGEGLLLAVAAQLESASGWTGRRPPHAVA